MLDSARSAETALRRYAASTDNEDCRGGPRKTIPWLANPAPGTALAAARWPPAQPVTASAVTESAGLREASAASGAARPRVWRSPGSGYRDLSSRGRSLIAHAGGPAPSHEARACADAARRLVLRLTRWPDDASLSPRGECMPDHQVAEEWNRVPTVPCLTHGAREERWRSLTACATRGAWTTKGQKGLRRCEVAKPPAMALSLAGSASAGARTRQNLSG